MLSSESEKRIDLLFPPNERDYVRIMLAEEYVNNLSGLKNACAVALDRYRFAVLKLSVGDFVELEKALRLAKRDGRDLLVEAGLERI